MNRKANVASIETIRAFRPALVKFADQARAALNEIQGEVRRTAGWLEREQGPYWNGQIRKRREQLQQAKLALNEKRMFDAPGGGKQSAVDEERALKRAQRRLEEAEQKVQAVKRWRRELEREWMRQQGLLQSLARAIEQDVPRSLGLLERMSRSLEAYTALAAPSASRDEKEAAAGSVARSGSEEADTPDAVDEPAAEDESADKP